MPVWLAPLTPMARCKTPVACSVAPSAMLMAPPGPARLFWIVSVPEVIVVAPL
jgi:hypothetical protein